MVVLVNRDTPPRGVRAGVVLGGRYSIVEAIGAGGMGTVYRAVQLGLGRDVAIKLIGNGRSATAEQTARFEREAMLLARLSHPSIVTVFDFGRTDDGTLYLVMELVRGESLESRLRRGRLHWTEAIDVGLQVSAALDAAHTASVLHRDLKPSNVMLSSATASRVKLIDFGLARLGDLRGDTPMTASSSTVMGTPGYIAPEYAWSGVVSPAMDHYALGLLLYEMIAAQHPFVDVDPRTDRLVAARERLEARAPETPSELMDLVCALLSPEPSHRPSRPSAALAALSSSEATQRTIVSVSGNLDETELSSSSIAATKRGRRGAAPTAPSASVGARVMVPIPEGVVSLVVEGRLFEVRLRPFRLDKHLVTHGDWYAYVQAGGAAPLPSWREGKPPRDEVACPVTGVSFDDAAAYARWAGRRLPTEAEWLWATSGPQSSPYPWGERWQTGLCDAVWSEPLQRRRPGPIGMFSPMGDSVFGVSDVFAVWEWVSAPYQTRGAVVRGGAWRDRQIPPRLENRSWEDTPCPDIGFRCAF
jgi:serine/threonine protein kinase